MLAESKSNIQNAIFVIIIHLRSTLPKKYPSGDAVKKAALLWIIVCCAGTALAGFKAKAIKAKKPGQFQCRTTLAGVTYAADLLLEGKDQEKYFQEALRPFNLIAVRLAVFNEGEEEVVLPMEGIRLLDSEGEEFSRVDPDEVARAVLGEEAIVIHEEPRGPVVGIGGYDPRYDPNDPRYDPNDPRYDPSDPRNRGQYPPDVYPTGRYPSSGTLGRPGVVLDPGGGGGFDKIENERKMIAVDFRNKAHTSDPITRTLRRDRFLYFVIPSETVTKRGIVLIIPVSKGIPEEVVLRF